MIIIDMKMKTLYIVIVFGLQVACLGLFHDDESDKVQETNSPRGHNIILILLLATTNIDYTYIAQDKISCNRSRIRAR